MRMDGWYCAGWSDELTSEPIGRSLLGRHMVLFRDASGAPRALAARCPHRGADLARGGLVDGCIECPFHGWRFDGAGNCVRVPSQPETTKLSSLARVPSFTLREQQGVLWAWMGGGDAPSREPPPLPRWQPGPSVRRLFFPAELVDAPILRVIENAFDRAHVPFIHRGTFGPKQDPLVTRQRVTVDAHGRGLSTEDDPTSPWQATPQLPGGFLGLFARLLGLRRPIAQRRRFDAEGIFQISIEYPNGSYDHFVTYITPADEGHTWLFVESVRTRASHAIGDWIQRRTINRIFQEGKRETSLILDAGPEEPARPLSVESDRAGLCARQLYQRWARGEQGGDVAVAF